MKKLLVIITILGLIVHVQSQNQVVEVYLMDSNEVVKGLLIDNGGDSIQIQLDSVQNMAFAKSDLEGRELKVSREVRYKRFKLLISELLRAPGQFQMEHGQILKGKILKNTIKIGNQISLVFFIGSMPVFLLVGSNYGFLPGLTAAIVTLSFGIILQEIVLFARIYNDIDILIQFNRISKNRYYWKKKYVPNKPKYLY